MFLPGTVSKTEGPIAALTIATTAGGTNWPGACVDPETKKNRYAIIQAEDELAALGAAIGASFGGDGGN